MKLRVVFFVLVACVCVIFFSCRRNQPSLIDANRPPETEVWYAPLDSTEYTWNVHMYWRGIDFDGVVVGYIWTVTDTLEADPDLRWNPAERIADLEVGRITTRTDAVIPFTAFRNVAGVGLRKNQQTFHIAAIDDNGVIDPTPAVVRFVATVGRLPDVRFHTTITSWDPLGKEFVTETHQHNPSRLDTLGMFRPFSLSYRGVTSNGMVTEYKYYPLTAGLVMPGQDIWSSDLSDTVRYFPNRGAAALSSGVFRFVAQCRDQSGAESAADVKSYTGGVVQVVVNYEPDTEIFKVENNYFISGEKFTELLDFDEGPVTVPYSSWVTVHYRGWDDARDSSLCEALPPPQSDDRCIGYQIQLERTRGASWRTLWYPPGRVQDSQPDIPDSNTKNIGTWDYKLRVRAVDEYGKPDGTMFYTEEGRTHVPKSEVSIIGNFDPTLDDGVVASYDGAVASSDGDTIVWDWWRPANYPDTMEFDPDGTRFVKKIFYVEINAVGHDHPKENARFGIVNWEYNFLRMDTLEPEPFFFGQGGWRASGGPNVFTERFEARYRYPDSDTGGASVWADPPGFWNSGFEFSIQGRDIGTGAFFDEYMFVEGNRELLNSTIASESAKRTEIKKFWFFLKVER